MSFYFQLLITLTAFTLLTNASPLETDNTEAASLEDIDLNTVAASVNTTDTDPLERKKRSTRRQYFSANNF